jgi:hypothetical protein
MITNLWIIGFILFVLSMLSSIFADGSDLWRKARFWEKWALILMLSALAFFGTAMYLTSQQENIDERSNQM